MQPGWARPRGAAGHDPTEGREIHPHAEETAEA